jgi:hypothetical protein
MLVDWRAGNYNDVRDRRVGRLWTLRAGRLRASKQLTLRLSTALMLLDKCLEMTRFSEFCEAGSATFSDLASQPLFLFRVHC